MALPPRCPESARGYASFGDLAVDVLDVPLYNVRAPAAAAFEAHPSPKSSRRGGCPQGMTADEAAAWGYRTICVSDSVKALRDRAADHRILQVDAMRRDFFGILAAHRDAGASSASASDAAGRLVPTAIFHSGVQRHRRPLYPRRTITPRPPPPPGPPSDVDVCPRHDRVRTASLPRARWRPALARKQLDRHLLRQQAQAADEVKLPPHVPHITKWKGRLLADLL